MPRDQIVGDNPAPATAGRSHPTPADCLARLSRHRSSAALVAALLLLAAIAAPRPSSALFLGGLVDKAKNAVVDAAKDLAKDAALAVVRKLWEAAREPAMKFFEKVKPKLLAAGDAAGKRLVDSFLALIDEVDNLKDLSMDVVRKLIARLSDLKEKIVVRAKQLLGDGIALASEAVGDLIGGSSERGRKKRPARARVREAEANDRDDPEPAPSTPRVEPEAERDQSPPQPPAMAGVLAAGVQLGADVDVLVTYGAAVKAETDLSPDAAATSWKALAKLAGQNPYRAEAAQRAQLWEQYAAKRSGFEKDGAQQLAKLRTLLGLPVFTSDQKNSLVKQFSGQFRRLADLVRQADALLRPAPAPQPVPSVRTWVDPPPPTRPTVVAEAGRPQESLPPPAEAPRAASMLYTRALAGDRSGAAPGQRVEAWRSVVAAAGAAEFIDEARDRLRDAEQELALEAAKGLEARRAPAPECAQAWLALAKMSEPNTYRVGASASARRWGWRWLEQADEAAEAAAQQAAVRLLLAVTPEADPKRAALELRVGK